MYLERTIGISSIEVLVTQQLSSNEIIQDPESQQSAMNVGPSRSVVAYKKHPALYQIFSLLALIPLALASFIAASRSVDNMHFPADIVGGSVLGASVAIYCHRIW